MEKKRREGIVKAATLLRDAERPVRVLSAITWPDSVRERFLANGARELPEVTYEPFTRETEVIAAVYHALSHLHGDGPVEEWLRRQGSSIEIAARMLAGIGTPAFFTHGRVLYGEPTAPLPHEKTHALGLAQDVDKLAAVACSIELGGPEPACHLASLVAGEIRSAVQSRFGDQAPEVVVVDELSSNAIAGPKAIRVRRSARFTDRDAAQLIQHEAYIHVCTSLNGQAQTNLPILGAGHPGTTRTQEGLAVFAEFMGGAMEPDRFRRLADRVLAIQMAIEGGDFLDVYRFFLERTHGDQHQAFENARRVFRGGILTGGAPFTKDVVYLDGLLRVTNFLRLAVGAQRMDCITLLFCGKLDLLDLPALSHLLAEGLLKPPRFLPPWVQDRRFLVAYLTYSHFLNQVDLNAMREPFQKLLSEVVRVG